MIDVTPPTSGQVSDGDNVTDDVDYTSEAASVTSSWRDFHDWESGVQEYSMAVIVNDQLEKMISGLSNSLETFTDHSLSLQHGDRVKVKVTATNRAGSSVAVVTDGMTVDHTPPQMVSLGSSTGSR